MPVIRYPNFSDGTARHLARRVHPARRQRARPAAAERHAARLPRRPARLPVRCRLLGGQRDVAAGPARHARAGQSRRRASCRSRSERQGGVQPGAVQLPVVGGRPGGARRSWPPARARASTIIDNERDGFACGPSWGQRLFFNQDGQRASLTGTRMSRVRRGARRRHRRRATRRQRRRRRAEHGDADPGAAEAAEARATPRVASTLRMAAPSARGGDRALRASDVEEAVIGHGEVEGPFTEIDGLAIERDDAVPDPRDGAVLQGDEQRRRQRGRHDRDRRADRRGLPRRRLRRQPRDRAATPAARPSGTTRAGQGRAAQAGGSGSGRRRKPRPARRAASCSRSSRSCSAGARSDERARGRDPARVRKP